MQAYDILILALLIAAAVWGARRGLARQLASLASLVVGYMVAVNFRQPVAQMIEVASPWNLYAAMLALFMGTSLAIWIAYQFLHGHIKKLGLDNFDTQMGALFGLAKGGLIAVMMTMFAVVMLSEQQRYAVLDSFSGWNICRLLNRAHSVVPTEWQQAMTPYLQSIEGHSRFARGLSNGFDANSRSPSDLGETQGSRYDDPGFAVNPALPASEPASRPFRANRSDDYREQPFGSQAAQAILLEPTFDQR